MCLVSFPVLLDSLGMRQVALPYTILFHSSLLPLLVPLLLPQIFVPLLWLCHTPPLPPSPSSLPFSHSFCIYCRGGADHVSTNLPLSQRSKVTGWLCVDWTAQIRGKKEKSTSFKNSCRMIVELTCTWRWKKITPQVEICHKSACVSPMF